MGSVWGFPTKPIFATYRRFQGIQEHLGTFRLTRITRKPGYPGHPKASKKPMYIGI